MSIPTRFDVILKDGTVLENKSWFTMNYTDNLKDRNVWLDRFRETLADRNNAPVWWRERNTWINDIDTIYEKHNGHEFKLEELI